MDEFLRLSGLDKRQDKPYRRMMEMRCIERQNQTYICAELGISRSTLNAMVQDCKRLYDEVQPSSNKLRPRNT